MKKQNLLFILSDEHTRDICGCYGHPQIRTPNLDSLAKRGTVFENAYTPCPICIPARASLNTGRYVHNLRFWDNGLAYDGTVRGWNHELRDNGYQVDSIGKLHFKGQGTDHGFSQEINPLHVVDGIGDVLSCIRDDPPFRHKREGITEVGSGNSTYLEYDDRNASDAEAWLQEHARDDEPWALFVGFVLPHPPYIAPPEDFAAYPPESIQLLPQWKHDEWPAHPVIDYLRRFFDYGEHFGEETVRRLNAAYYGMVTYLDRQIGRVFDMLRRLELEDTTRVIYSSDHGECLGARGLFGKFTMYEESAAIPMIMAGPDIPAGHRVSTPVNLVDIYPTVLEAFDLPCTGPTDGTSLFSYLGAEDPDRSTLSEYHAVGSRRGSYMIRKGRYKYAYYIDAPSQLFDLETDPQEKINQATNPEYRTTLQEMESALKELVDPEDADRRARADQIKRIDEMGGREALIQRGAFDNSPVPGETPKFHL